MNILKKANEIVNERSEEKERTYGPFSECNRRAAEITSIMSNKKISVEDVYNFQIALKLARNSWSYKEDNILDAVAYLGAYNNYKQGIKVESNDIIEDE